MSTLQKFDALLALLNAEENELALELRESLISDADSIHWLECLESAGVDNWGGYYEAQKLYEGEEDDE